MITIPPRQYIVIKNPALRDGDGAVVLDKHKQVRLQHGETEIRMLGGRWTDPFPLQPGENQIEVRATLGAPGEATEQDCVWVSAAAAGGCTLSGPPPPCADPSFKRNTNGLR